MTYLITWVRVIWTAAKAKVQISFLQLNPLDPHLKSSWTEFNSILEKSLLDKNYLAGSKLIKDLEPGAADFIASTDYSFFAVAFAVQQGDFDKAFDLLRQAYIYGYPNFWMFEPLSHGWGLNLCYDQQKQIFTDQDGCDLDDEARTDLNWHRFLKPLYLNTKLMNYVRSKHTGQVTPWGFDLAWTPFCWLDQAALTRKNEKCLITNKKLEKGTPVYRVRFFNGSYDIPTEFFYADIKAADQDKNFLKNKDHYLNNSYSLKDFNFKVGYRSGAINQFWHELELFDLEKTLQMIVHAKADPTPFQLIDADQNVTFDQPVRVQSGAGCEYLNLLWVIVKCGYLPEIVKHMDRLPGSFKVALLLIADKSLRQLLIKKINLKNLSGVCEVLSKEKISDIDILSLVEFGQTNSDFQDDLARALEIYEMHLYSNYHPGANWFYADFSWMTLGRGGRLLYILASRYEKVFVLQKMGQTNSLPFGLGYGGWDAYTNSAPYLYQTLLMGLALAGHNVKTLLDLSAYENDSLDKASRQAAKIIVKLKTKK